MPVIYMTAPAETKSQIKDKELKQELEQESNKKNKIVIKLALGFKMFFCAVLTFVAVGLLWNGVMKLLKIPENIISNNIFAVMILFIFIVCVSLTIFPDEINIERRHKFYITCIISSLAGVAMSYICDVIAQGNTSKFPVTFIAAIIVLLPIVVMIYIKFKKQIGQIKEILEKE